MKMLKAASLLSSFSSLTLCEMQFSSNKPHTYNLLLGYIEAGVLKISMNSQTSLIHPPLHLPLIHLPRFNTPLWVL